MQHLPSQPARLCLLSTCCAFRRGTPPSNSPVFTPCSLNTCINATVLQHLVQKFSSRTRIHEGCHLHPLPSVIFTEDAHYSTVAFDTSWVSADGQETPLLQDICPTPGAVTHRTGPSPAPCSSWVLVTIAYTCYHVVWTRDIDLF